jgi:ABC-type sugar transport system substrate-binding protein
MKRILGLVLTMVLLFSLCVGVPALANETPKFGYVVNDMSHEWYQNIVKGAQARAEELGIELKVADAAMDVSKQVSQLENMLTDGVDVLIITPVDVKALAVIINEAAAAGVPVVSESNVIEGAKTYVGIDNLSGGKKAGEWFVEYAKANNIDPKILIVGLPAFEDCRLRVQGFKEAMDEAGFKYEIKQEVDGQGSKETSLKMAQDALTANPDVNVIFGINDNSTTGGMAAYKEAGLDESNLTAIGFGFEGVVGREALLSGGPYKAAVACSRTTWASASSTPPTRRTTARNCRRTMNPAPSSSPRTTLRTSTPRKGMPTRPTLTPSAR